MEVIVIHCSVTGLVQYLVLEQTCPLVVTLMRTRIATLTSLTLMVNSTSIQYHWPVLKVNDYRVFISRTTQQLNGRYDNVCSNHVSLIV